MSHARIVLSTVTFATALSLSGVVLAADPAAPTPGTAPAPSVPATPDAPATVTPAPAAPPSAPAPAAGSGAAETTETEASDEEEEEDVPDSDATPEAPSTKPSPALLFLQSRRPAPAPPQAEAPVDDGLMGTHQDHFHLDFGIRASFIPNEGYDLFSKDNDLTQISLSAGRTVFATGDTSFAASLLYDWGPSESELRGADTSLHVNRLSVGLEGRYHLFRRLYVFGRLAPGALRFDADLGDAGAGVLRESGGWLFSADLGAGAAFEVIGEPRGISKRPRGFLIADGGYGWTSSSSLEFVPEEGAQPPARLEPLELGELAFRGGYFRIAAALTY
jgi:hypothetical protein